MAMGTFTLALASQLRGGPRCVYGTITTTSGLPNFDIDLSSYFSKQILFARMYCVGKETGAVTYDYTANAYQECGITGLTGASDTKLVKEVKYYFKLNGTEYNITTVDAQLTYTHIMALLNTATTGVAVWALKNGDLRCTLSATTESISIVAGTTGDDLLAALNSGVTMETAATYSATRFHADMTDPAGNATYYLEAYGY